MCFGGDSSPPSTPSLPPPPPPIEMMDVFDNARGVSSIIATDPATGKKVRHINVNRSPEVQALYDLSSNILRESMREAVKLAKTMPDQIVDFKPFVDRMNNVMQTRSADFEKVIQLPDLSKYVNDFSAMNQEILDREFTGRGNDINENLARRGYGQNSTASTELKAALAREQSMANKQLAVDSLRYGRDLYERDLSSRLKTFEATEANRQAQLGDLKNEYLLEKTAAADKNNARQTALQNLQGLYSLGSNVQATDLARINSSPAPQLGVAEFQAQNQNQLGYYNASINKEMAQHRMNMDDYDRQPPSVGQKLLEGAMTIGGMAAMGAAGRFGTGAGTALSRKFFG